MVTLAGFLTFWGWVFIVTTTLIAFFKHEAGEVVSNRANQPRGVKDIVNAYQQLYNIIKLPAVRSLALVLLTAKVINFSIYFKNGMLLNST